MLSDTCPVLPIDHIKDRTAIETEMILARKYNFGGVDDFGSKTRVVDCSQGVRDLNKIAPHELFRDRRRTVRPRVTGWPSKMFLGKGL